jgi:hypothetical protein
VYATLIHAKTNCDGYKEQGITYPSGQMQKTLLEEFYQECAINPTVLDYIEAHGTGTKVQYIEVSIKWMKADNFLSLMLTLRLVIPQQCCEMTSM